jgi:hypothetical protein
MAEIGLVATIAWPKIHVNNSSTICRCFVIARYGTARGA